MDEVLEIYFSDLTLSTQAEVLSFLQVSCPENANLDTKPLFELPAPENEDEDTEEDYTPDEEDAYYTPTGHLGSRYDVSMGGKYFGQVSTHDEVIALLKEEMKRQNYYPNLWFIDDHGGSTLETITL